MPRLVFLRACPTFSSFVVLCFCFSFGELAFMPLLTFGVLPVYPKRWSSAARFTCRAPLENLVDHRPGACQAAPLSISDGENSTVEYPSG